MKGVRREGLLKATVPMCGTFGTVFGYLRYQGDKRPEAGIKFFWWLFVPYLRGHTE